MAAPAAERGPFGLPTDPPAAKTMFMGLGLAFVIYLAGFLVLATVRSATGVWLSTVLTGVSLVFVVAWLIAVKRGFRVGAGRHTRAAKRRKERERGGNPFLRR